MDVGIFEKPGIRFFYPEDWTVVDEDWLNEPPSVTVHSSGSAFWELHLFEEESNPQELAENALRVIQDEYELLECSQDGEVLGVGSGAGYNVSFYCLDLLVTAHIRAFSREGRSFLIICQGEDRDFEALRDVFAAITLSLFRSDQPPA